MNKTLVSLSLALLLGCASVVPAQVVRVGSNHGNQDAYSRYYRSGTMLTFTGQVTGIESVRPAAGGDPEVTLLVKNRENGGTAVVDIGPQWFVDNQVAHIRTRDNVQVTGSKVIVDRRGIILASQVLVNGQGGPVLALRRADGQPYWFSTTYAQTPVAPTGQNAMQGTISSFTNYVYDNVPYSAAVVQTNNGYTTVDLGPTWYYGRQNLSYQVGDHVQVVVGPNPIVVNPNLSIAPTYSIYNGPNIYTVRDANGNPVYNWRRG